jgi:drug/metabolite transporter (DMT)-like permease
MTAANPALALAAGRDENPQLALGIAVGLLAASISALYTVVVRRGIAHGLHAPIPPCCVSA